MASNTPVTQAHHLFHPAGVYLNTASSGLPPDPAWQALQATWRQYRDGTHDIPGFDLSVDRARSHYARLLGVPADQVAVGNQTSVFIGTVAASLPDGAEILTASDDFTSVTFPFLAQRRLTVREVPLSRIADEITSATTVVAVAAVQSADGAIADLAGISAACAATGCLSVIDATQAAGWYPLSANDFDITVASGYKWLLAPRGTAFMTIRPELMDQITPVAAGWYAGEDRWTSIYGSPLRLARSARRFDISPAWHSWVGAAPALELLADIGSEAIKSYTTGLANGFRAQVGLPPGRSAIVSVDVLPGAEERIRRAGIVGAVRAGRLRLSFHLSNSAADVTAAADALTGFVRN